MPPFLDEEDYATEAPNPPEPTGGSRSHFFRNDKKFLLIGGAASIVAFCVVAYILYSSSKPINLEELPVIKADETPFKIKPEKNEQVKHQDKTVYDNISGAKRKTKEKIAQPPEEVLSIPEIESGESLSDEEKKSIIQAFDELAPEKEYKIKYVKKDIPKIKTENITIVEDEVRNPPIHRITAETKTPPAPPKKTKQRLKDIMEQAVRPTNDDARISRGGGAAVQIASVATKPAAEAEYNRIASKNKFLKSFGKKIVKVDLGKTKGIRYRIQVGPFKTRKEAEKVVSAMAKNGFHAYVSR
ncbi:MAG: SPOR domain-containing protein [Holosporaceae bacterium]|jgi:cell division septation protein DedD|nr:SPOR domain-containing protein [Holosporaceae bacterium]